MPRLVGEQHEQLIEQTRAECCLHRKHHMQHTTMPPSNPRKNSTGLGKNLVKTLEQAVPKLKKACNLESCRTHHCVYHGSYECSFSLSVREAAVTGAQHPIVQQCQLGGHDSLSLHKFVTFCK